PKAATPLERCEPDCEIVRVNNVAQGLALLRTERFDGVYASPQDPAVWERAGSLLQSDYILDVLSDAVALVNSDLRVTWANTTFTKWCGGPGRGPRFYQAPRSPRILPPRHRPLPTPPAAPPVPPP